MTATLTVTTADGTAEAVLDPAGFAPTEPDAIALRFRRVDGTDAARWAPERLSELAAAALERAAALGLHGQDVRVVIGWDPLDAPGIAALESAGFVPTGRHPYFVLGGGHVEYVTGYTDVTGATVDLAATVRGDGTATSE